MCHDIGLQVLLWDEATSALDDMTERAIHCEVLALSTSSEVQGQDFYETDMSGDAQTRASSFISQSHQDRTTVLAAHRLSSVLQADRVAGTSCDEVLCWFMSAHG